MGRKALFFMMAILVSLTIIRPSVGSVGSHFVGREIPPVVSTDWLAAHLHLSRLIVLDVRSPELYRAGHIPKAINVPEGLWYVNPPFGEEFPWMEMPPKEYLFELIGSAGITSNSLVVVVGGTSGPLTPLPLALYSTAGITRVAITLLYAGVVNVAVLDGGYEKWVLEGKQTTTEPTVSSPIKYDGTLLTEMVVSKEYVLSRLEKAVIVDARDIEVYLGLVQEPWTVRLGHIPTAKSLPTPWLWNLNLDASVNVIYTEYKSYDFLKALAYDTVGSDLYKEIIIYCGVGGYASTLFFVLKEMLGYINVRMYDGSAQEWTSDIDMPMTSPPERVIQPIVSTTLLSHILNLPNLVVLDVRDSESYIVGHIPGAVNVPEGKWYANPPFGADSPWMELPPRDYLYELIGNAGIANNSIVVVVGSTSGPLAPIPIALYNAAGITRVAITLLYAGVVNVAVLDGGYEKWVADGYPIETGKTEPVPVSYAGVVKSGMVASKQYVSSRLGESIIVDSRDVEVYLGFIQEPWAARPGHIPTARNLPTPSLWSLNLNATGTGVAYSIYRSVDMLETLAYSLIGTDKSKEIIVYCGVGGYASTMLFVLSEVLKFTNVKMYDGSAQEWTGDSQLPVSYEDLSIKYMELSNTYDKLQKEHGDLLSKYDTLEANLKKLQENYNVLSGDYNKLESNYKKLSEEFDKIKSDNNMLQEKYKQLSNQYERLETDYNALSSKYNELKSDYDQLARTTTPAYLTYAFLATTIILAIIAVVLALRPRKKLS